MTYSGGRPHYTDSYRAVFTVSSLVRAEHINCLGVVTLGEDSCEARVYFRSQKSRVEC